MRQPLRRIDRDRVRRVRVCIAHVTACCREPEFRRSGYGGELASTGCVEDCPARVVDLTRVLGLAQSTVSGHLACLRDCGLVTARPAGLGLGLLPGPARAAGPAGRSRDGAAGNRQRRDAV